MLQLYISNISAVSNVCCNYFIWMLHMLHLYVSNVSAVSNVCCKCFILILQCPYTYVANVCCKYFICFGHLLQQMLYIASVSRAGAARECRRRWSPRAQRSPCAHGKQSGRDTKAQSTTLYPWTRQQARSTKLHSWTDSRCRAQNYIHK
jgi:hypothetical protein